MSAGAYRKILATSVMLLLMSSIILFVCCSDVVKCCLVNNEHLCYLYFHALQFTLIKLDVYKLDFTWD